MDMTRREFLKDSLAAKIGSPEFPAKAKLDVAKAVVSVYERREAKGEKPRKEPGIRIGIPEANGNPASRTFSLPSPSWYLSMRSYATAVSSIALIFSVLSFSPFPILVESAGIILNFHRVFNTGLYRCAEARK